MSELKPLVSIIVPVYGTEKYLPVCIESICKQSYHNIQIVLVDDQSPDRCPEICDKYAEKDERITVVHQKNKGVSGARNVGIDCATGDYIMFVDSDDELFPEAVETLLKDALDYNADIVWAKSGLLDMIDGINIEKKGEKCFFNNFIPLLLLLDGKMGAAVWSKLFKVSFIKGTYFEERKNINEDSFFMFQCCLKKPIMLGHDILIYKYNFRQGSCSRQIFSDEYLSMLYFCEKKKEIIARDFPEYVEQAYNMEVRTNLQFLDVLCRTTEKRYKVMQKQCIETVRRLYEYHRPINVHHKKLAWIVKHGLYPLYKFAVHIKYYRK